MKPMTKGTRRSTHPIVNMLMDGKPHRIKIEKYLKIGYRLVKEDGYMALMAYYPYNRSYVKLVTVEHGNATNTVLISKTALKAILNEFDKPKNGVPHE